MSLFLTTIFFVDTLMSPTNLTTSGKQLRALTNVTTSSKPLRVLTNATTSRKPLRVLEGVTDENNEYPYVVALVLQENFELYYLETTRVYRTCTGSLLNPEVVLTAAHCFLPFVTRIRYGDMTVKPDATTASYSKILKKISHPAHNVFAGSVVRIQFDIGLMVVEKVTLKKYGKLSAFEYTTMIGHPVKYTGFGVSFKDSLSFSEKIEAYEKDARSPQRIGEGLVVKCPKFQTSRTWFVSPMICLVPKCVKVGQRASEGDSGGPVLYRGKIAGVACGVVSDYDFRYTPVSPVLDWIHKIVAPRS